MRKLDKECRGPRCVIIFARHIVCGSDAVHLTSAGKAKTRCDAFALSVGASPVLGDIDNDDTSFISPSLRNRLSTASPMIRGDQLRQDSDLGEQFWQFLCLDDENTGNGQHSSTIVIKYDKLRVVWDRISKKYFMYALIEHVLSTQ